MAEKATWPEMFPLPFSGDRLERRRAEGRERLDRKREEGRERLEERRRDKSVAAGEESEKPEPEADSVEPENESDETEGVTNDELAEKLDMTMRLLVELAQRMDRLGEP